MMKTNACGCGRIKQVRSEHCGSCARRVPPVELATPEDIKELLDAFAKAGAAWLEVPGAVDFVQLLRGSYGTFHPTSSQMRVLWNNVRALGLTQTVPAKYSIAATLPDPAEQEMRDEW